MFYLSASQIENTLISSMVYLEKNRDIVSIHLNIFKHIWKFIHYIQFHLLVYPAFKKLIYFVDMTMARANIKIVSLYFVTWGGVIM